MKAYARRALPVLASAALVQLAFPPFNLGLLVFVGLVPWLMSLRAEDCRPFRSGYAFGFLFYLAQMHWLVKLVGSWVGSPALGAVPMVLAALLGACHFGLLGWLVHRCWRLDAPWAIPLVWAGVEVFRSYVPVFAFPFGLLATPLWLYTPLIQGAWLGTIYLVGAWAVAINLIVGLLLEKESLLKLRPLFAGVFIVLALSFARFLSPLDGDRKTVVAGQLGIDMAFGPGGRDPAMIGAAADRLTTQSLAFDADLLVLPEGVAGLTPGVPVATPWRLEPQVPTVFGAQRRGEDGIFQAAFGFDGNWSSADKTRLVIFGEFVPGRSWIPFLDRFNLPSGDLSAGRSLSLLRVGDLPVGPVICFEGLFPDIALRYSAMGARTIGILSIDDWYMGTGAPAQLRAASVFRAVESGLPVVRSASLGHTMVVDARGRVVAEAPIGREVALRAEVVAPPAGAAFPGWWVFPGLSLLSVLAAALWPARKP